MYINDKKFYSLLTWKKIAEKGEIEKGKGKAFKIEDKQIAIFNQDGYHAMDDLCVHQDGSIAPGKLEGDIVECPLHFWHYNIKTGELTDYLKDVKLETYSVETRDDGIYVDI
jgi:3-phenylpropionate/trans-cinnamate dioxygenase ferredoxin component